MNMKQCCSTFWPARPRRHLRFLVSLAIAALLALVATTPALAANGRDFAGLYHYDKTADLENQKQVNLSLRLFNYSGSFVGSAVLILEDELSIGQPYGSIAGISLDDGASVPITGSFAIPDAEYQRWQAGALPHLWIDYIDANGSRVRRPIELVPALMGEQP